MAPMAGCPAGGAPRGRQLECAVSPDGKFKAFYRARNFWVANADGTGEVQVTTDGSVEKRIKNGSGSWVYGEELGQTTAIWWAPNSQQVGYYRFDESDVKDFYLGMNQTGIQTALDVEAYPKAGAANPVPDISRLIVALSDEALDHGSAQFQASNLEFTSVDVGNPASNVIPGQARAKFNIRFNDLHTQQSLRELIELRLAKAAGNRIRARIVWEPSNANVFVTEPGAFTDLAVAAIEEVGR